MASKNVNRRLFPRDIVDKSRNQSAQENINIKEKERISEQLKEKYIEDLEERNKKLKYQIQRITDILEENDEKQQEKIKQRQKNHNKNIKSIISASFNNQNNPEILKKELENVYKQIKNYEREIQKVENFRVGSKNSSDEISRLSSLRHEKLEHLQRLNQQLSDLSNLQAVNSKKLKNNMGRQYYENQIIKIGDQLKVLRQKLRAMEEKEKKKLENAKKQLEFINKLQNQLLQKGISMDQIQELKKKNFFIQIKNIMNKEKDLDRQDSPQKANNDDQSTEEQHVTFQKLQEMKNEIKLYKKLHQDYEKRLQNVQKEKENVDKIIAEKKKINQQKNAEIQTLLNEINQVKQLVRKNYSIADGTLPGNPDSIRKLHRKKVLEASRSQSKEKEGQKKSTKLLNSRKSKT